MVFRIDTTKTIKPQLRAKMLTLRKRVFCDKLGWNIPHCNGQEADIFDFEDSYYLNWLSADTRTLLGSVRLMPMSQCNLLNTVFLNSIAEEKQTALTDNIRMWEGTRLCIDEALFSYETRSDALITLLYGLFRASEEMGIETLICNCNSIMFRKYRQLGFHFEYMGSTKEFQHGQVHCLSFHISSKNLHILMSLTQSAHNAWKLASELFQGQGIQAARYFNQIDRKGLPDNYAKPLSVLKHNAKETETVIPA